MRSLVLALLLVPAIAAAQAPGETPAQVVEEVADPTTTSTNRISVGLAYGAFVTYPMAFAEESFGVVIAKPLWLGKRRCCFQWVLDADMVLGYANRHVLASVGPQYGFNIYIKSLFGFELRFGSSLLAQLGRSTVFGFGMLTESAAFVVRPWVDDRRRIKLGVQLAFGAFIASDPGDDTPFNAGHYLVTAAYETPF